MATLDSASFVLQRRINRPFEQVQRTIANPAVFGFGCIMSCTDDGVLQLDAPFQRFDVYPRSTWCADASLLNARRRRVAKISIEIGTWSSTDTELLIRPACESSAAALSTAQSADFCPHREGAAVRR